jgi:hypothetical protein
LVYGCVLNWKLSSWDIDQVYQASASAAAAPQEPTMATDDKAPPPTPPAAPPGPAQASTPADAKKQAKRAAKAARKAAIASQRARRK